MKLFWKTSVRIATAAIIFIISTFAAQTPAYGEKPAIDTTALSLLPSSELLRHAENLFRRDTLLDSTIIYMNEVVNRWHGNPKDKENRKYAVTALRRLGIIYSTRHIDYREAFRTLTQARDLAEEDSDHRQLAYIYQGLSNLYYFNPSSNNEMDEEALKYQKKAYYSAVKAGGKDLAATSCMNLSLMAFSSGDTREYEDILNDALIHDVFPQNEAGDISRIIVKSAILFGKGENAKAISGLEEAYKRSFQIAETGTLYERDVCGTGICLIELYSKLGDYNNAIKVAHRNLAYSRANGNRDFELSSLSRLYDLFESAAMPDSAEKYHAEYLELKEEFSENQGYGKVEPLHMQGKIDELHGKVNELSGSKRLGTAYIIILITIIIILAATTGLLLHRRARLRRKSADNSTTDETAGEITNEDAENESRQDDSDETVTRLTEEEILRLKNLFTRVEAFMVKSEDIYRQGFSLADLSACVSAPARVVSKAISLCRNVNFNQYLNEYRIRRAISMMDDPEESNHTIQSIAERSGFKSRTHFTAIFKGIKGETPSEYWTRGHSDAHEI